MHDLLRQLAAVGLSITQHRTDPRPDEWYAGTWGHGDVGPFPTAEIALLEGIAWLIRLVSERIDP